LQTLPEVIQAVRSFVLFLFRRLLGIVVLVWAVTLLAFGLFRVGVPSPAADAQINAQLGPGEPATWQYFTTCRGCCTAISATR
jgi:hypothetical protein